VKIQDIRLFAGIVAIYCLSPAFAQKQSVPHLVQFSGTVQQAAARPVAGITFALYKDQEGGAPMWMETQNVALDENGPYTALLGSTKRDGLPAELFTSGEARWLGVQPEGQTEQPRALLLSVPYALKAVDAETVGGLPPAAFVLAPSAASGGSAAGSPAAAAPAVDVPASGAANVQLPEWLEAVNGDFFPDERSGVARMERDWRSYLEQTAADLRKSDATSASEQNEHAGTARALAKQGNVVLRDVDAADSGRLRKSEIGLTGAAPAGFCTAPTEASASWLATILALCQIRQELPS